MSSSVIDGHLQPIRYKSTLHFGLFYLPRQFNDCFQDALLYPLKLLFEKVKIVSRVFLDELLRNCTQLIISNELAADFSIQLFDQLLPKHCQIIGIPSCQPLGQGNGRGMNLDMLLVQRINQELSRAHRIQKSYFFRLHKAKDIRKPS